MKMLVFLPFGVKESFPLFFEEEKKMEEVVRKMAYNNYYLYYAIICRYYMVYIHKGGVILKNTQTAIFNFRDKAV